MKRIVPIYISVIVALFSPVSIARPQFTPLPAVQPTPPPVPVIKFRETTYDTGEIWEGDPASHTFTFTNTGNAVLIIKKVKTSCGCTAAVLSSKEIEPGKTGEIKATFNTRRYLGKQSKSVYVSSNDPRHPTVQLRLQAVVKSAASFSPRNLQFGQVTRGEEPTKIIQLIPDAGEVPVTELTTKPEFFKARIVDDTETEAGESEEKVESTAKQPVKIEVSISPDAPIGRHNGNLTVKIDHPRVTSLSARLFVLIEGPVRFSPRMLFFDENAQKNRSLKKVRLEEKTGRNLKILSIESSVPQFQAELVTLRDGREFDIEIRMSPDTEPGRYQGEIVVKTDCPGQEEIKIPVRSNVKKK